MTKKVDFGERLKQVREDKLVMTQKEFAIFMHDAGFLKTPNQARISTWENMEEFRSKRIRKALIHLNTKGINPEFFFKAQVTDWNGTIVPEELDEGQVHNLLQELQKLKDELIECRAANKALIRALSALERPDARNE